MRINPIALIALVLFCMLPAYQAMGQHVRVVTPGQGITFLPGCVNGIHWGNSNCEFQGSIVADEVWAIEIDNTEGSRNSYQYAQVTRAETGEDNITYQIWLSSEPNGQEIASRCTSTSKITTAWVGAGIVTVCPVPLDIVYLNVRALKTAAGPIDGCGSALVCRPKITGTFIY